MRRAAGVELASLLALPTARCRPRAADRSRSVAPMFAPERKEQAATKLTTEFYLSVSFVIVVSMTLITTPWGVRLAHAMDPKPLKRVFAVFIMVMALNMLRKALGW